MQELERSVSIDQLNAALSGRYTVDREIGHGGMATVYLARDVRHNRAVAVKVLKPDLGAVLGVERFLSEIEVTANLQHPNLLPLFDSGEANGLLFYVMPYIKGESLRAQLDREKQLPIDVALQISTSIAAALDYAHRQGVIHRDLKPENILMHDGQPLVADFGIALAVSNAGGARVTQTGLSLGTPQYMSPEQATGDRAIDSRTDIYSLGSLTYEMLVGEPPHTGSTAQAVMARVLTEKPRSIRASRATVPMHVEAAVERALEKLPADRWATAKEYAEALTGARAHTMQAAHVSHTTAPFRATRWTSWAAGSLLGAGIGAAAMFALTGGRTGSEAPPMVTATLPVPEKSAPTDQTPLAFSPDGKLLVYAAEVEGVSRLYLLKVGEEEFRPIPGSEGASAPFFSPTGESIAFFRSLSLHRMSVNGGPVVRIADAPNPRGGSWGANDVIVYAPDPYEGLMSIDVSSANAPERFSRPDSVSGADGDVFPDALPGGEAIVFTARGYDLERTDIIAQRLGSTERKILVRGAAHARYVSTGHLVFSRGGTLFAVQFDPTSLEVRGTETPVADSVLYRSATGGAASAGSFAVSPNGVFVYLAGGFQVQQTQLVRFDRAGKGETLAARPQDYWYPKVSPDGKTIAVTPRGTPSDIWLYDIGRNEFNKVTFEGANWSAAWSPDGQEIAYQSVRGASRDMYRVRVAGGTAERIAPGQFRRSPDSWSPNGNTLAFTETHPSTGNDIWLLPLSGNGTAKPWLNTAANESSPMFSPDGQWLAYSSTESGRSEVYVQPVAMTGEKWLISTAGGVFPVWSRDGRELYYSLNDGILAVPVTTGKTFTKGAPIALFTTRQRRLSFDVDRDGRFVFVATMEPTEARELRVVVNWFDELERKVREGR